jgi:hypothetical protein
VEANVSIERLLCRPRRKSHLPHAQKAVSPKFIHSNSGAEVRTRPWRRPVNNVSMHLELTPNELVCSANELQTSSSEPDLLLP